MASRTAGRARAYGTPGNYRTGVWLVAQQDGSKANIVDRTHLPTGPGWQYYWLGANFTTANNRLGDAMAKLGVNADQASASEDITKLLHDALSGKATSAGSKLQPIGHDPLQAPGTDVHNAVTSTWSSVSDAINSTGDFLKFIAWIFHPRNILRAVEFLVGGALMIFGFQAAMQARGERIEGFATSEGVLTRSGLGRVATELGRATTRRERPQRPRSAPHRTRQRALSQRYSREERVRQRERKGEKPTRHTGKTQGSGAGTRK